VALVPSGAVLDPGFEEAPVALNRRGYPVHRMNQAVAPPGFRDRMADAALAAGFAELLWLDPALGFDPDDVPRLRTHNLPVVCGPYPSAGKRRARFSFAHRAVGGTLDTSDRLGPMTRSLRSHP
jgi:hypothetical protein